MAEERPLGDPTSGHRGLTAGRNAETGMTRARFRIWPGWVLPWGGDSQNETPNDAALIDELHSKIIQLENQLQNARGQIDRARSTFRTLLEENQRLRQAIGAMKSERDIMNRSVQNQEVRIRQVQALVFEGIGSESWATGDDSTVRADLENLHGRLKCWAKKHAIEDMSQVRELAPEEYGPLIQVLAQVVQLHSGTPNVIEHLESTPMINKKSPAMCIQGLLAHHVYTKIISRPFFVFRDGGDLFQGLFEQIRQVDENEAHILRSRTLRLLATPPPNRAQGNGTYCYTTNQKAVCHELAGEFYESPVRHLIKPPSREGENAATQCLDDLASIFQYAGELSYKLWTRRTTLEISTLRDLRGVPFRMDIEYMKAHPLHRLYEDDDRCDGWFASVVAHPAVVGYGSSDGKDYTTPRVWMKAEVWLAEDAAAAFGAAVEGEV